MTRLIGTASLSINVAISVPIVCPLLVSSLTCIFCVGRRKNVLGGCTEPRFRDISSLRLETHHLIIWARYNDWWTETHTHTEEIPELCMITTIYCEAIKSGTIKYGTWYVKVNGWSKYDALQVTPTYNQVHNQHKILLILNETRNKNTKRTWEIRGYSDADYTGDNDTRKSVTGYIVLINIAFIAWCSQSTIYYRSWIFSNHGGMLQNTIFTCDFIV